MKRNWNYRHTIRACYLASMTQAVICCFAPLLFVTFQDRYGLSLEQLTLLTTLNFLTQLVTDAVCARVVDRIGTRTCIVAGHLLAAVGLASMAVLPELFSAPLAGLLISTLLYAIGGGVIEVLASPIMEACPTENKEASMSLMHSFYCWGSVAVVVVSTLLFNTVGIHNWKVVACLWALLPLCNGLFFTRVPLAPVVKEGRSMTVGELMKTRLFWILLLMMMSSGAAEQVISQWASAFAERGLGVTKTVGDLAGPCFFALLMGVGRVVHVKLSGRIPMERYMRLSALLCVIGYALVVLPPIPVINLLGCGVCGFAVAVLWPGSLSIAAKHCPRGGTAMFALLALGGDTGCALGPTLTGFVSGACSDNLKIGIGAAVVFPVLVLVSIGLLRKQKQKG